MVVYCARPKRNEGDDVLPNFCVELARLFLVGTVQ